VAAGDGTQTAAFVTTAIVTAGGVLSPDVDNRPAWRATIGRTWAGFAHRRITHWWGIPAGAAAALTVLDVAPVPAAAAWGAVVGWGSHIAGDFVFGQAAVGRGPGVPLLPTRWHVGLALKADGATERFVCRVLEFAVPVLTVVTVARLVSDL
jgi:hypothetical protein